MNIAEGIPRIVAGSAAAGFGLSLGRDVYRGTKPTSERIIVALFLALLILPLIGLFYSGLLIARNYRDAGGAFRAVVAGLLFAIASLVIGTLPMTVLFSLVTTKLFPDVDFSVTPGSLIYPVEYVVSYPTNSVLKELRPFGEPLAGEALVGSRWLGAGLLFMAGALAGLSQRSRRRRMFSAEKANEEFFLQNGLEETSEGQFTDSAGNKYRFERRTPSQIELFALGRRNRRGFIEIDKDGRFTAWSGLVPIR